MHGFEGVNIIHYAHLEYFNRMHRLGGELFKLANDQTQPLNAPFTLGVL